jgi:hypothetical protein
MVTGKIHQNSDIDIGVKGLPAEKFFKVYSKLYMDLDNNLKEKIVYEISRINYLFDSGKPLLDLCKVKEPDCIKSSAAALLLHSFYNGIESIVLMILKNIGEDIPDSF